MAAIYSKMQRCVPDITAAALWEQLATLYDFSELEDSSAEDLLGDGATGGAFELPKTKGWYAAEMSARGILPDGDVSKASRKHDVSRCSRMCAAQLSLNHRRPCAIPPRLPCARLQGTKSKTSTRGSDRKRKR